MIPAVLDLTNQALVSLDQVFSSYFTHHGAQGPQTLLLTHNQLTRLFNEPPSYQGLSIEALDLRDNMIEDIYYTVGEEVQRYMPNVKDLKMNLYDEDHVDYIMRVMPQLQYLNGLPVERDEESPEKDVGDDAGARFSPRRMNEMSASAIMHVGNKEG